ncbi:hypothetical protein M9H77_29571 [Catharanthus roseus]|uniref:Uncharacterized protein n=1 Tax=Catharanthus roseus TaxID=4058 RepID=A0ACB9ZVK5_CATRO|nr:hypothetical protein M9H77_29571 [Catharanthus roseus]
MRERTKKTCVTGRREKVPLKGLENVKLLATLDILNPRPQEVDLPWLLSQLLNVLACLTGSHQYIVEEDLRKYSQRERTHASNSSSTKCLPYDCFLTKVFQYFVLNLVGVGDPIGARKINNKHTFRRMGFEKNEKGILVRGGQDESNEYD